jgi:hypothetical protein
MSLAVILVLLAFLAVLLLVRAARMRAGANGDVEDLTRQIRSVDVEAFRNLLDPAEEQFLRSHLPGREFRRVQRQRLRAAAEYVHCASRNAVLLARVGEAASRSPEVSVAEAGARLLDSATQLRFLALQATGRLYLGMIFPSLPVSAVAIPESYERMAGIGMTLGRLQHPSRQISTAH